MCAGTKNRQKEPQMKECFFVWRGWNKGRLIVNTAPSSRISRLALEVAIADLDPFQRASQREWQSARTFLNLDKVAS